MQAPAAALARDPRRRSYAAARGVCAQAVTLLASQEQQEDEAEAEQRGLKQQLLDMRSELRELRASSNLAEREVASCARG